MNKFDQKYNEILNEAGFMSALGSAARGAGNLASSAARGVTNVASAIGSGIKAAENPGQAAVDLLKRMGGKKFEERAKEPISAKNPVDKGEKVWCNTIIYSIGDKLDDTGNYIPLRDKSGNFIIDPTTKRPKAQQGWVAQETSISGTSLTKSDEKGNFKVKLDTPNIEFFNYVMNSQSGASRTTIVVGDKTKLPAGVKIIGNETTVGQSVIGIDQSLKTWFLMKK
jgi:hypothetical protein